jgi:succinyl-diaminopimelate desuccinylase
MANPISDDAAVELLQTLVRAPSPSGRERPAVDAFNQAMSDLGFDEVSIDAAGNSLGVLRRGEGPTLHFNGHIDTVPTGDRERWPVDPLGAEIVDGALWGRGSVDMKGALAAMAIAARQAADDGFSGTLILSGMVQEEVGGLGAWWFGEQQQADLVVLGEPSDLRIKLGHRGRIELRVSLPGRIAHAAKAELGDSAILRAARYALALERLELPFDDFLGRSSATITQIRSYPENGANVVPGRAELTIDYRNVATDSVTDVIARLARLDPEAIVSIEEERAESEGGSVTRSYPRVNPAFLANLEHPAVAELQTLLRDEGLSDTLGSWWFATDAPHLAAMGAPILGFGPGNPEVAHTTHEAMPIDSLLKAVRVYRRIASSVLQPQSGWGVAR